VPKLSLPNASFVKEREAIPVAQESPSSAATLSPHAIKVILLATWELLRNPSAEDMLRQMLVESTGPALDAALFSTAAATPERSAGLLNGIPPLTSTGNLTNDLIMLLAQIAVVSGNGQIAVVAAPDKAVGINLLPRELPYPVLTSASLPPGTLIAIALNGVVSAVEGAPKVEASTQAVVHMETVPATNIGGGAVAPLRSLYQTDTVRLKLAWGIDWALRDSRATAWTQGT